MKKVVSIMLFWVLLAWPVMAGAKGYYFHEDHLGGSAVVTDEDGEVAAVYDYYPFGEVYQEIIYDEEFSNSYKFTGQEEDEETGLYYYGARYYNAGVGRFMSQDPALYDERLLDMLRDPQSLNTYSYVLNNPVIYTDPSGELPKRVWRAIAKGLDVIGYDITASLLSISTLGGPNTSDGVLRFHEGDSVTKEIRKSDEYKEDVLNVIHANIDSGVTEGVFLGEEVEFNEGDLGKAFHGIKDGSWFAREQEDGSYNIYITLNDIYDFEHVESEWYDVYGHGNNEAYIDQEEGDLATYDIKIYMQESYTPDDN